MSDPEPQPSLIESLSAITLEVSDMDVSLPFYQSLGFTDIVHGGAGAPFTSIALGHGFLNLQVVADRDPQVRWGRVVFHVVDVDVTHATAVAAGHQPEFAPKDAVWGERYFHLRDPDGHELSFARPLPKD